jgi:hypothetical protein
LRFTAAALIRLAKTYRRRQPVVLPQFQWIAESNEGSVIDENSMAGYVKTCAQESSAMALSSQTNTIQLL